MKRRLFLRGASLTALAIWYSSAGLQSAEAQTKPSLTVSAAASMKDALSEINARYSGASISVNYGASGALQRQIENGAPVDVFISAAAKNMDELQGAHLVDAGTRRTIAANRLVLVVPRANTRIHSFTDLNKPVINRFAMGAPESVPAGKYAQQVLTNLHIYGSVQPKAVFGKDVREVLTQVELGNVDAGIVYKSDAQTSNQVRIAATAPAKLHDPITYPAAVVSDSKDKTASNAYIRFLTSSTSRAIFKKYGFLALKK